MSIKRINNFLERHSIKSTVDIRYAFDSRSMMSKKKLKLQEALQETPGARGLRYELGLLRLAIASRELNEPKQSKPKRLLQALKELQLAHLAFVDLVRNGERTGCDVSLYRKRERKCRGLLPKAIERVGRAESLAVRDLMIDDYMKDVRRSLN